MATNHELRRAVLRADGPTITLNVQDVARLIDDSEVLRRVRNFGHIMRDTIPTRSVRSILRELGDTEEDQ